MSDSGYAHEHRDEGGPSGDKRLWVIAGILGVIAVIAIALLVMNVTTVGGKDDDDQVATVDSTTTTAEPTTTTSSTSTTSSTTTEATTTSTEVEETTTTSSAPPPTTDQDQCRQAGADPSHPEPAAQTVFGAWTRGDAACAQVLMTGEAFDQLFSRSGAEARDEFQGCWEDPGGHPHIDCAFTYEGSSTHYLMNFSPTDGWIVFEITHVAD